MTLGFGRSPPTRANLPGIWHSQVFGPCEQLSFLYFHRTRESQAGLGWQGPYSPSNPSFPKCMSVAATPGALCQNDQTELLVISFQFIGKVSGSSLGSAPVSFPYPKSPCLWSVQCCCAFRLPQGKLKTSRNWTGCLSFLLAAVPG